ncbi:class I SAM-dependent methyltransferase [Ideonella sp. 4Y16]|uniref:class I SAM-dependent methyltransferase n=1 Tax=Ideonella alba TaxID=2824118 RepID=UPI001B3591AE|nr:class I SAM-dependent methyltransferase [Ideonella alba]MBQ0943248.1 class I SAM-dependent methyltransferase [Ideonella alba]
MQFEDGGDTTLAEPAAEADTTEMRRWLVELAALVAAGGPQPAQYPLARAWLDEVGHAIINGRLGGAALARLRQAAGAAMQAGTMQGRAWLKPLGYAGDFRIIDDIYCHATSPDPALAAWDRFFHEQPAVKAVRNRKAYFKQLVRAVQARVGGPIRVLDVACGPCRDVAELLEEDPALPVHLTCLDADERALAHARTLCDRWPERTRFIHGNALRLRLRERFDLVWSAGLLDYFDDRGFVRLVSRLLAHASEGGGEVVVGNFGDANPSRPYQVWTDWHLAHRSAEQLHTLGRACSVADEAITVEREPEGVNLFLRLRC